MSESSSNEEGAFQVILLVWPRQNSLALRQLSPQQMNNAEFVVSKSTLRI